MTKVELKKEHKDLYTAGAACALVEVPQLTYLMIDGAGDPNTVREYQEAVSALYTVAYKTKFIAKADRRYVDLFG